MYTQLVPLFRAVHRIHGTYLEGAEQALVDAHHGTSIIEFATVVGCAEKSNELALRKKFIAILDDLVGATDQVHIVLLQKTRNHVGPKGKGHAAVIFAPPGDVFIRIGPQQVAQQTAIRNLDKI